MTAQPTPTAPDQTKPPLSQCPACFNPATQPLLSLPNIPVHSCLLVPSEQEGVSFPRGALELRFCQACGFVFNARFDVATNAYSRLYEETQGFSPTFNAFAKSLAQRLVQDHQLQGKTILEIGCGKGEFLSLLCELAPDSRGIGIDPGYIPSRNKSPAMSRMEFIVDLYDRRYAHLPADYIACRHTLEHIAPVETFLSELRLTIGARKEVRVFLEVPDILRELREGAFWDIYYEHCSYFSCGSLARLFRRCHFDVVELELGFDDQYILLTAVPTDGPTEARLPLEFDLEDLRKAAAAFPKVVGATMDKWRTMIQTAHAAGRRVVLWGGGSKGVAFLTTLGLGKEVHSIVDINPFKHGKFMPGTGHPVIPPAALKDTPPDLVVVMNPIYVKEIGKTLSDMGLSPELVAV